MGFFKLIISLSLLFLTSPIFNVKFASLQAHAFTSPLGPIINLEYINEHDPVFVVLESLSLISRSDTSLAFIIPPQLLNSEFLS